MMTPSKPNNNQNQSSDLPSQIIRSIVKYWVAGVLFLTMLIAVFFGLTGVYSVLLGSVFSLIGFWQLINDQYFILVKRNRKKVFISYLFRLAIYSVPIVIALKFPNYFKFLIILICLFISQIIYIVYELVTNYQNYKKRMAKNG